MIKHIIFDIGQVLLAYTPWDFVQSLYKDEKIATDLYETLFLSEEWLHLDRGITNYEEVIQRLELRFPMYCSHYRALLDKWTTMLLPIEDHVKLLETLHKEQYSLFYLSNFQELAFQEMMETYHFFRLFDGGIVSYKEQLMKPEPQIFQLLLSRYHLNPEECLFLDDSLGNVEAARALGFHAIHVCPSISLADEVAFILQVTTKKQEA